MFQSDARLILNATWLAGIVAGLIALTIPLLYFSLSYQHQITSMQAEAEFRASNITRTINANPELWQFEEHRLQGQLTKQPESDSPEWRRIVNTQGVLIAQTLNKSDTPYFIRSSCIKTPF